MPEDILDGLLNCKREPLVNPEDPYQLGVVTKTEDGTEKFTPVKSGKSYDDLRPFLISVCQDIDTKLSKFKLAYWEVFSKEQIEAMTA